MGAFLACACSTSMALGGLSKGTSWQRVSDDGQFVLVSISSLPISEDCYDNRPARNEEIRLLRGTYRQSGIYRNDGSTDPVWTLPFVVGGSMFLTADGKYLVMAHDDWRYSHGQVASFYHNGTLLKRYDIFALSSHYKWSWRLRGAVDCRSLRLNGDRQTFTVATDQGETYVFDITTGNLVRSTSYYPLYFGTLLAILIGISTISFAFFVRRRSA
jgi:hypothetical protein